MVKEATTAMKSKTAVTLASMLADEKHRSATPFSLLVLFWKRRAWLLLHMPEENNGYEAINKLEKKAARP